MPSLRVEVCYALPGAQRVVTLALPEGATAADAVHQGGLASLAGTGLAIHGRKVRPEAPLKDGDRVDILRPLPAGPREARRLRARREKR